MPNNEVPDIFNMVKLWFPNELIRLITKESNSYAKQQLKDKVQSDITNEEVLIFLLGYTIWDWFNYRTKMCIGLRKYKQHQFIQI